MLLVLAFCSSCSRLVARLPLLLLLILPQPVLPSSLPESPCQLPTDPTRLAHFCQLPYHQVPFICDPGGILSRTESELIDRRLQPRLNLTGCMCPSRPCAQQDRRQGQLRAMVMLVPNANLNSIRKCIRDKSQSWEATTAHKGLAGQQAEFVSATGQFAQMSVDKLLGPPASRERCDPDLFVLYIDRWSSAGRASAESSRHSFVARIFRRNLAQLRDLSQVERVDSPSASPFELLLEQLNRALLLAIPEGFVQPAPMPKAADSVSMVGMPSPGAPPWPPTARAQSIPSWAIYCTLGLILLALCALIFAHWFSRRISLGHQKKFSTASRMSTRSTRSTRTEEAVPVKGASTALISSGGRTGVSFGPGLGGGQPSSASHLKSQMMFRQFSRKTTQQSQQPTRQKI